MYLYICSDNLGGYTVLATKSLSSMLTMKFVTMFTYSITYLILIVLMGTAVLQIRFLNKALKQFDSTVKLFDIKKFFSRFYY